ncbi:MAG: (2Fe-2S)-binding protein [Betaproteobacteria bacterium]|nr:(2Fe-2S)-binding protein [Betaproteobacteria bacterium]
MFKLLPDTPSERVTVLVDDVTVQVPPGYTAAAAMLMNTDEATRTTATSNQPRAPYCMMGVCFECLMEINGVPNQQGCLVIVSEGMRINRQQGKREINV